jgi:hypothetical protein
LERRHENAENEQVQQYVYVLEANLAFHNGLSIPLMSEFLSYGEGDPDEHKNSDEHKQDCERQAFKRLAERLKQYFPRLPVMVLLDGLYPNGPVMEQCRHYLMRLAHAMNALAQHTQRVARQVRAMGLGAFLSLVCETCANRWLSPQWCRELLARPFQLRLE